MEIVTCPEKVEGTDPDKVYVFVAGGISNCPDWQPEMMAHFEDERRVVLMNPRRYNFNIADPDMSRDQIYWEHNHLELSDVILFWFPKETLCPITLFELGKYASRGYQVFVGCHPEYARKFDVEVQLSLINEEILTCESIEEVAEQAIRWIRTFSRPA